MEREHESAAPQALDPSSASTAAAPPPGTDPTALPPPAGLEPGPPAAAGAPEIAGQPPEEPTPAPAATIDPAEYQRTQAELQQYRQAIADMTGWAQQQHAQQAMVQAEQEEANYLHQARQQAASLAETDPERALDYYNQHVHAALQYRRQRERQIAHWAQQQTQQVQMQMGLPLYAQHLIKQYHLPDDYAQHLAGLPPEAMERQVKLFAVQQAEIAKLRRDHDQTQRSHHAQGLAASGAHRTGGLGGSPSPGDLPEDPEERAMAIYNQMHVRRAAS